MSRKTYVRKQPIAAYLMLLIATIGAYLAYQSYLVPMVEVAASVKRSDPVDLESYSPIEEDKSHYRWFKQQDWERESCSILHTAQGKILFQDFEREDEKTWIVFPFTLVMDREQETQENARRSSPPLVLRCAKGARLKFDQPVSATGGSSNFRLENAQLEGNVEVFRKSVGSDQDEMRIETSNVFINQDQIVTIEDVAFWFGNNQGIGRNLKLQLSHQANGNQISNDFSRINGVTSVRLGYLSSMQLQPTKKGRAASDQLAAGRMLSTDKTPVEITSAGPFQFDFATNLAQFEDQVQVRKLDAFGDSLKCDRLILQFKSDNKNQSVALDSATDNEFELVSMLAQGKPAVLESRSQNAEVIGSSLQYDLASQTVKVSDPQRVQVKKDGSHFLAASIEYKLTQDNKIGPLVAQGPGQLVRSDGTSQFRASWEDSLQLSRASDQQQVINLKGDVKVSLDKDSELSGSEVKLLIWEVPVFDQQRKFVSWSYQPGKLKALRNIRVTTDQLIADANTLEVNWPNNPHQVDPPQPLPPQANPSKVGRFESGRGATSRTVSYTAQAMPVTQRGVRQIVRVRKVPQGMPRQAPIVPPVPPTQPLVARSEAIEVSLIDVDGKSELSDLQLLGNVLVTRKMADDPMRDEFEIRGDALRMIPQQEDLFHVQLQGSEEKNGRIKTDDLELVGRDLFLDQLKNVMWVKGQGQVRLKDQTGRNAQSNRIATGNVAGTGNSQIKKLNVSFLGGMIFDGKRLYFERGVVADVVQQEGLVQSKTLASGTALSINLDRALDFGDQRSVGGDREPSQSKQDPKIVEFIMRQSLPPEKSRFKQVAFNAQPPQLVEIRHSKLGSNGEVLERLVLRSPHASMNESKKELTARGPGFVQIHRKGRGDGKGSGGFGFLGGGSQPNSNQYTFIHVNFENQLITNTANSKISINGNLRSMFANVANPDQKFNPDVADNLPVGAVRLHCEQIDVSESKSPFSSKAVNQFLAFGNAHIQSDNFDSVADRISYRDDTDELTVESTSGKNVALKVRRDEKSSWQQVVGSEIIYRTRDKTAEVKKVGRISAELGSGR